MKRPIAIGLAPNTEKKDALLALKLLLKPWNYLKGDSPRRLEDWFRKNYKKKYVFSLCSGRGALYYGLKALGVKEKDEVILQAFTCAAVVQAVKSTKAKPVYADIDDSLTINPDILSRLITPRTKAIIIQHTFGNSADLDKIKKIAKEKNIFIIEDCAHGIYPDKKIAQVGDIAVFSFGRDKAFSCVSGGIVMTGNKDIGDKLKTLYKGKDFPSTLWVIRNLLHPFLFYYFVLPFYNFLSLGKVLLVIFQKMHFLSFPVDKSSVVISATDTKKMPPALAELALLQLTKLDKWNKRRVKISEVYKNKFANITPFPKVDTYPLLRFPICVDDAQKMLLFFRKKKHIYLGNWYSNIIDPKGVDYKKLGYIQGSCPKAEEVARKIINLPTYPLLSDADVQKVVKEVSEYVANKGNN
ncbi:MAG TPA: aminotransferase class V-fold PLP-dependent enzyme [Patescibacteria group bacterium]